MAKVDQIRITVEVTEEAVDGADPRVTSESITLSPSVLHFLNNSTLAGREHGKLAALEQAWEALRRGLATIRQLEGPDDPSTSSPEVPSPH